MGQQHVFEDQPQRFLSETTSHEQNPLLPHHIDCILVLRKLTTCGSISEIITENHLCLHTCFWYYQFCYIHFLELNSHVYHGSPKEDLRGRPYLEKKSVSIVLLAKVCSNM